MSPSPESQLYTPQLEVPPMELSVYRTSLQQVLNTVRENYEAPAEFTEMAVIARAMGMHILLEGPPGGGKTELAKQLSEAMGLSHARVNGHPETLPSDFIGYVAGSGSDEYLVPGAIFTHTLLADELNRVTPKSRNALLQPIAEGLVNFVINGQAVQYKLPKTFSVIATQNPNADHIGATAIDPAQLDRFSLGLTTTGFDNEGLAKIERGQSNELVDSINEELSRDTQVGVEVRNLHDPERKLSNEEKFFLRRLLWIAQNVKVDPQAEKIRRNFVRALASNDKVLFPGQPDRSGLKSPESPRMNRDLLLLSLGNAVLGHKEGNLTATEEDLKRFIEPATVHRLSLRQMNFKADNAKANIRDIVQDTYKAARKNAVAA